MNILNKGGFTQDKALTYANCKQQWSKCRLNILNCFELRVLSFWKFS